MGGDLNGAVYPDSNAMSGYGGSSHPALDASGAHVIDQLTGVGFGVTILLLSLGLSLFGNFLQFKRNNSLVDQILNIVPTATSAVLKAVADFKEAINELRQKT